MKADTAKLAVEYDGENGWRYRIYNLDGVVVAMSTQYYPAVDEVIEDLRLIGELVAPF